MPKLKILSGPEVVRILSIFGFKVASQRGSHIKLRRKEAGSGQQTLTIPNHKELDRGRVEMSERVGQHPDHCSYAIKPAS